LRKKNKVPITKRDEDVEKPTKGERTNWGWAGMKLQLIKTNGGENTKTPGQDKDRPEKRKVPIRKSKKHMLTVAMEKEENNHEYPARLSRTARENFATMNPTESIRNASGNIFPIKRAAWANSGTAFLKLSQPTRNLDYRLEMGDKNEQPQA